MEDCIMSHLRMMGIAHWSLVDKRMARGPSADIAWRIYARKEQVCRIRARNVARTPRLRAVA